MLLVSREAVDVWDSLFKTAITVSFDCDIGLCVKPTTQVRASRTPF